MVSWVPPSSSAGLAPCGLLTSHRPEQAIPSQTPSFYMLGLMVSPDSPCPE